MIKKTIGKQEFIFDMPKSMCAIWDVFYMISTNPNRAQLGRLFAAIIGIMLQKNTHPKYSLSDCDLMAYGGKMQEWLSNHDVGPVTFLNVGTQLFEELSKHIATEKQVKEAENFTINPPAE